MVVHRPTQEERLSVLLSLVISHLATTCAISRQYTLKRTWRPCDGLFPDPRRPTHSHHSAVACFRFHFQINFEPAGDIWLANVTKHGPTSIHGGHQCGDREYSLPIAVRACSNGLSRPALVSLAVATGLLCCSLCIGSNASQFMLGWRSLS